MVYTNTLYKIINLKELDNMKKYLNKFISIFILNILRIKLNQRYLAFAIYNPRLLEKKIIYHMDYIYD